MGDFAQHESVGRARPAAGSSLLGPFSVALLNEYYR